MHDGPVELRRCTRCQGIVYEGLVCGVRTLADVVPLDPGGYGLALAQRRLVLRLVVGSDGAAKLMQPDDPSVPSTKPRIAAHGCPAGVVTESLAQVASVPPGAPAPSGKPWASSAGATVVDANPATPARSRPFLQRRCCQCETIIGSAPRMGLIRNGYWDFVMHEECNGKANA